MPSSITLSHLTLAAPDGRPLLTDLDFSFGSERTGLVGRNGVGKTTLLRVIAGTARPAAGSVAITGTIALLEQLPQLDDDATIADLFGVRGALDRLARIERGVATDGDLAAADWTLEPRIAAALARLALDRAADTPLASLSGGQRTRAALAALTFAEPDFLLLDEPTNNLDRDGRRAVLDLLAAWRRGAIVVSHDRELLGTMDAIVELTTLGATRYGGNWGAYRQQKAIELAAARHDLADARKEVAAVARKAQDATERQARRDKGGRRKAAKGDLPRILLGARKGQAESTSGAGARLAERQAAEASAVADAARARIEVLQPFAVALPSTGLLAGKTLLRLDRVAAGYGAAPILHDISLAIVGPERVALTGRNGSGKTTLLRVIAGDLAPSSGTVARNAPFALLDQEVRLLDPALSIRDNFRRLNPGADENAIRAALARFMFRADAALQVAGTLSGGQRLRAALASILGGPAPPPLLILDEPTNHLDLDAIAAVEAGLRAYDGALLVVSHDEAFLDALAITRRIEVREGRIVD